MAFSNSLRVLGFWLGPGESQDTVHKFGDGVYEHGAKIRTIRFPVQIHCKFEFLFWIQIQVVGNGSRGCQDELESGGGRETLESPFEVQFLAPHHLLICCVDNSVRKWDLRNRKLETILIGS